MIELSAINRAEVLRYLGNSRAEMTERMTFLLDECESEIIATATPKYLYKTVSLGESGLLVGESITRHMQNCENAVVICATLGAGVDKLIRTAQVTDMAKTVVLDAMASAAIEQVCNKLDGVIAEQNEGKFLTWRFSPGYGDYPIDLQKDFLTILDAPRKIGLCTNDNSILTPTKSVTAIMGVSDTPLEQKRRGCASCNMAKICKFRKNGERCEF